MAKKALLGSVDLSNVSEDFKWYIIVTKFNYEEKYVNNVKQTIQDTQYESLINDYYIPIKYIKKTVTLHDGTKKDKVSKIKECYSNYVFIHCKMTKLLWNLLRTITGAAVILSTGGIPVPIDDAEMMKMKLERSPEGFTPEEEKELFKKVL